ncbi:MAG: PQQ-binding-like beta-propeller repeat protein [Bacteroidales bacterium]|nr:PQQ-binding-like beta-propeller repeat protein [Bacteroidales bacterium]
MKALKHIVTILSITLLLPSCYKQQQLDYSNWYTVEKDDGDPLPSEDVKGLMIMSSNVRYYSARNKADDPDVGDRDWEVRKKGYFQMVNTMQPMVIGLQEAEMNQVTDIVAGCKGYSFIGVGRKDGAQKGESTSILYKTDEIQVEEWGTVWLSPSPNVVGSYFPEMTDGQYGQSRTATWAVLTAKENGRRFFYINTHFSLYSASQPKEVQVILNTVTEKCPAGLPVVLSADWNLEETDPILAPILDSYASARQTAPLTDNIETFHWWGSQSTISKHQHLDHIFWAGFEKCLRFRTLNMKWEKLWISDHHPVYAIFQFKTGSTEKQKPVADFEIPANPMMDETIKFTDKSTSEDGIEVWEWNIGGIVSSAQNPEVMFNTYGDNIPVSLTVTDHYGQKATASKTFSVALSEGHDLTIEWSKLYDDTTDGKGTAVADWTAPAVTPSGDRIYVASSGYHIVGFNPDGSIFGSYDIGKREPCITDRDIQTPTPSIDSQGNVYIPVQYGYSESGNGGLYSLQPDLSGENWYHDTGNSSQYRNTIPAIFGDYVAVVLTNSGNDLTRNAAVFRRSNGSLVQVLECDKGSWGGMAVGYNGELVYATNRGGTRQGREPGTETGGGYHVAQVDGSLGNWKTSANSDDGRKTNLLGMRHSDGNGYLTKAGQPAVSTDHCVYVCSTSNNENMICAKYNLDNYVFGSAPTPIWKVEQETHSTAGVLGLGCVLDAEGNAYFRAAEKVFRLNGKTGEKGWVYNTEGDYNTGVPAIDAMGYLYVVDYGGNKLLKLSSADGKLISSVELDNPRTSPTIAADGTIYVTGSSTQGAILYKIKCQKTTAPGPNWSQLGGNPQKTCTPQGANF